MAIASLYRKFHDEPQGKACEQDLRCSTLHATDGTVLEVAIELNLGGTHEGELQQV